jgi:hypothetical protein
MLKKYVKHGGSVLITMTEGGEDRAGTNINYFLEQFGMAVNNDAVVRPAAPLPPCPTGRCLPPGTSLAQCSWAP